MKLISVLMSVYNEPLKYIKQSVNSILNQTYSNIEFLIIIDDPKNDVVIKYLKNLSCKNKKIKLFLHKRNQGLIASLNEGIKLCNGDYIARMDADDIAMPLRLEKEINFLESNRYDIVGSNYYKIDNSNKIIGRTYYEGNNFETADHLKKINCVGHPTWLLKRSVYENVGGYRNIYSCEDYDFLIRATLNGYKIGVIKELLLKYRINLKGISQQNLIKQKIISNILVDKYKKGKQIDLINLNKYLNSFSYHNKYRLYKLLYLIKKQIKKIKIIDKKSA